ncbi:MAG: alanyl-tRNA editing protein [Candidatus Thermoplasmatota archaeon]|nr:alanyl-tRNA editing protein [Euryarchaeota archaeon]MBU4032427.1 alanyl-tRNA editing protein [Candidatus Thermoplasmatota archaeon]MBU4070770.1 alanyl-tRNA editing protein [Candidatus Thermoplasmatota archaeon]MBU4144681.1 alanyl-tRNA editing protein [Candidatus Thermoplasmatota archaeon]MBU4592758.1 alanyl-tRNA editing protein [Candidatus Thermoplasmatota archaeon]
MTEILYMPDIEANYIREWDAVVVAKGDDFVELDRTAFYPEGGGQPTDTGWLEWAGGRARVKMVAKKGSYKHFIEGQLPEGKVHAVLDWDRRYDHMRMHTAQHIVSGVVYDAFGARTVGNQLYHDRARVDFHPIKFTDEQLAAIEKQANEIIARQIDVRITQEQRAELEKRVNEERCNLDLIPKSVSNLRVIEVAGFDVCPCAGTHVRNTRELGKVHIQGCESKGKDRCRLTYELV